jgi:hypothetical protein
MKLFNKSMFSNISTSFSSFSLNLLLLSNFIKLISLLHIFITSSFLMISSLNSLIDISKLLLFFF